MEDIRPAGQSQSYEMGEKYRNSDEDKNAHEGKYGPPSTDADRIDVIAPTLPHLPGGEPNEKGDVQPGTPLPSEATRTYEFQSRFNCIDD